MADAGGAAALLMRKSATTKGKHKTAFKWSVPGQLHSEELRDEEVNCTWQAGLLILACSTGWAVGVTREGFAWQEAGERAERAELSGGCCISKRKGK